MTPEEEQLATLLEGQRVATLAVLVDGRPYASLVPFAASTDFATALIHASRLARHSQGLLADAPFSLLIHQPDANPDTNPAQLPRVTLQGSVQPLDRQHGEYPSARDRYLAKFPQSQITFQLGDFTLYALRIESCRFVAGFAKTFDLGREEMTRLAALADR
jgi:putative heme iron utilization protein